MLKNVVLLLFFSLSFSVFAEDLGVTVQGSTNEDLLSDLKSNDTASPYLESTQTIDLEHASKVKSPMLPGGAEEDFKASSARSEFFDYGYKLPGTFEKQENYLELDRKNFAKKLRDNSELIFNLTYIQDNYEYSSPNNIIKRTFSNSGSTNTGFLILRFDNNIYHNSIVGFHWSLGGGLAMKYAKGLFINGETSNAQFRLWQIPIDSGIGIDMSLTKWIKISATGGPSFLALSQNRSDLTSGEAGKNKTQFGFGAFGSAQFKLNLTGYNGDFAHELFISNNISNMYLNLEARYQNYKKFLDTINIDGTSFGVGVSFEFL